MKILNYGAHSITDEDIDAVVDVLKGTHLTQGPKVPEFESLISSAVGVSHSLAVNSGTAGLHLAAMALGVVPGDRVIITPLSFSASANCIRYCGAEVDFIDIDENNLCLDVNLLKKKLESSPSGSYKGVVVTDFAGHPAPWKELRELADTYNLFLIEDACHALGSSYLYNGKQVKTGSCTHSDVTIFSFHPVKHIAAGEGGAVCTNNTDLYNHMMRLRSHGITKEPSLLSKTEGPWYQEMIELGFNYRLTDICAALGASQIKRLKGNIEKRLEIAEYYRKNLDGVVDMIPVHSDVVHGYHLFIIRVPQREKVYKELRDLGIYTQVHYVPIHQMPYYKKRGKWDLPVVEKYYREALSIPIFHSMTRDDQERVVESVKSVIRNIKNS